MIPICAFHSEFPDNPASIRAGWRVHPWKHPIPAHLQFRPINFENHIPVLRHLLLIQIDSRLECTPIDFPGSRIRQGPGIIQIDNSVGITFQKRTPYRCYALNRKTGVVIPNMVAQYGPVNPARLFQFLLLQVIDDLRNSVFVNIKGSWYLGYVATKVEDGKR